MVMMIPKHTNGSNLTVISICLLFLWIKNGFGVHINTTALKLYGMLLVVVKVINRYFNQVVKNVGGAKRENGQNIK
jgi:hypothetical protein